MKVRCTAWIAAAIGIVLSTGVQAGYSNLFIFGDSLSDSGNNFLALYPNVTPDSAITSNTFVPTFPYASRHYTNDRVWAQDFASALGLSADPSLTPGTGGTNFAFGGARTSAEDPVIGFPPSLTTQVGLFLGAAGSAPGSALYVVAGGGNNARDALLEIAQDPAAAAAIIGTTAQAYATDIGSIVDDLQEAGARDIVVWNTPNVGLAPFTLATSAAIGPLPGGITFAELASGLSASMNLALSARLASETGVLTFDLFGLLNGVAADPDTFDLVNVTDACGAAAQCDPSTYLFWDGIHPTSAGHAIIADAMLAAVPEPSTYVLLLAGALLMAGIARRRVPAG